MAKTRQFSLSTPPRPILPQQKIKQIWYGKRMVLFLWFFFLLFQPFASVVHADETLIPEATPTSTLTPTPSVANPPLAETPAITPTPKPLWVEVDGDTIVTSENVGEGVDYNFRGASVRFTKVTKPGKLTIREIKFTSEQIAISGALSDIAYDITSDMESGTFIYDLTLPLPQNNQNAKVEFANNADS